MVEVRSPWAVFVDYPAGRTFGPPKNREQNEKILAAALRELPFFTEWGQIRDLPFKWEPGNQPSWQTLREELLRPPMTGAQVEELIRLRNPGLP